MDTKRTVIWQTLDFTPHHLQCGGCGQPILTQTVAKLVVENNVNHFVFTVCPNCGLRAEALFSAGQDFPGMELK